MRLAEARRRAQGENRILKIEVARPTSDNNQYVNHSPDSNSFLFSDLMK